MNKRAVTANEKIIVQGPRIWLFRHRRAVVACLIAAAVLACCAIFYPSYLEGTIPISSQVLAELDLETLKNDYSKLGSLAYIK